MNKDLLFKISLSALAGAVTALALSEVKRAYRRSLTTRKEQDVKWLVSAIKNTLNNIDIQNYEDFCEYLDEYYGITAKKADNNEMLYSSDKFQSDISSVDILISCISDEDYNISDLENAFETNKKLNDDIKNICHCDTKL